MKHLHFLLAFLLSCAAEESASFLGKNKAENLSGNRKTEDGKPGIEKRAPLLVGPTATPGIEYADVTQDPGERSPTHTVYATPEPQLSKISDVLSGHQAPFPAVIASRLLAPVSIYQARLSQPAFAVSQPVPSRLAYSEHKIYQPQPGIQYYNIQPNLQPHQQVQPNSQQIQSLPNNVQPVQQYQIKQQNLQRPVILARLNNYQPFADPIYYHQAGSQPLLYTQHQPQQQQIAVPQQQPIFYSQQPQLQTFYHQIPQAAFNQNQIPYNPYSQIPVVYNQNHNQHTFNQLPVYNQQPVFRQIQGQQPIQVYQPPTSGITYAKQQDSSNTDATISPQVNQRDLKQKNEAESANDNQKTKNSQSAYSYASFSQSPPQNYQSTSGNQNVQSSANSLQAPQKSGLPNYQKPEVRDPDSRFLQQNSQGNQLKSQYPQVVHLYQQQAQPQFYQQRQEILQPYKGFGVSQPVGVSANTPTLQYFGKFAQSIFGGYQPQ